jgi:glycosyltransferase involved in cell wall biosynthesis
VKLLYLAPYGRFSTQAGRELQISGSQATTKKIDLIIDCLAREGHTVTVLSSLIDGENRLAWRRGECLERRFGNQSVRVYYPGFCSFKPLGGLWTSWRAPALARALHDRERFDACVAVNSYLFESRAVRALHRSGRIPFLLEVEDLPLARRRPFFNVKSRLDASCWSWMVGHARAFTAVNPAIYDLLPGDRPRLLLPGIIHPLLLRESRSRPPAFQYRQRTLGYFGWLGEEKGLRPLLEAVPDLPEPWKLLISGIGPMAGELRHLQSLSRGKLVYLGNLELAQLYRVLCRCDSTVIPKEHIGDGGRGVFPFKTLEYLVAGTHVMASPLAGLDKLGMEFIARWDGTAAGIPALLNRASQDYQAETHRREKAQRMILEQYSPDGFRESFRPLLGSLGSEPNA